MNLNGVKMVLEALENKTVKYYEDLVKKLRRCGEFKCNGCDYEAIHGCRVKLNAEAADAIENLLVKERGNK